MAAGVEDAEAAAEVPEGPAPIGALPELEVGVHPAEGDVVRGVDEGAPLADVDADAGGFEALPGDDHFAVHDFLGVGGRAGHGPGGDGPMLGAFDPGGPVVGEAEGGVAAGGLGDVEVGEGGGGLGAPAAAVGDDEATQVAGADGGDEVGDDAGVGGFGDVSGLVDEIEGELGIGDAFVAAGKDVPVVGAEVHGFGVVPEVKGFGGGIDAVAGGAVEVEVDVDGVLAAPFDGLVDFGEDFFMEGEEVLRVGPA